jgi:competence protein ComGC
MIELIFVIVIIGILAAVAIPKMANTSKQAVGATYKSFTSTLNNTVGPTMWMDQNRSAVDCSNISNYIDVEVCVLNNQLAVVLINLRLRNALVVFIFVK